MNSLISKLYKYRFELFFFSQLVVLFGSLITPIELFDEVLMPILFSINIISGIILISKKRKYAWFFSILFMLSLMVFGLDMIQKGESNTSSFLKFSIYFVFYTTVTLELIKQVWNAKSASKKVIIGLMSGYISLGLIAFFIFSSIELSTPESFNGLLINGEGFSGKIDSLLYYSYITLLTIGYGDIQPVTAIAQKASVLIGLLGQFYIVIITAIVVEKYFVSSNSKQENN